MSAQDIERLAEIQLASTEQLVAYVARLRHLPGGLTGWQLRGVTLAQNELDRRQREGEAGPVTPLVLDPACREAWPECQPGEYDPRCCRFPKSCSCYSAVPL